MTTEKWNRTAPPSTLALTGDFAADHRARLALEQSYAAERRRQELTEQTSTSNTPGKRIRIWEQLHALTLPAAADHSLLQVIANGTGLSLEQIREEQRRRSALTPAKSETAEERRLKDPYCVLPGIRR